MYVRTHFSSGLVDVFKSYWSRIVSFFDVHPVLSVLLVWILVAKVVLSILTPLSADFLLTGPISSSNGIAWAIGTGNFGILWIILEAAIYHVWLLLPVTHPPHMMGLWYFFPSFSSFLLVFMYKLPLIVIDFLTAFLLYRIAALYGASHVHAVEVAFLWLANPYVTLMSEMWGAYDIIAQFFVLLSVLLLLKGRATTSALSLVMGIALKLYPIILLPVFALFLLKEDRRNFARFLATALLSLLILVGGLIANSSFLLRFWNYFFDQAFFLRGSGFEEYLPAYFAVGATLIVSIVYLYISYVRDNVRFLVDSILGLFLVVFALTFWHPQFFVWVLPFVTLHYVLRRPNPVYPILLIGSAFAYVLVRFSYYFSSYGTSVFFIPNYNSQLQAVSDSIYNFFAANWNGPLVIVLRLVFLGLCVYYVLTLPQLKQGGFLRPRSRSSIGEARAVPSACYRSKRLPYAHTGDSTLRSHPHS